MLRDRALLVHGAFAERAAAIASTDALATAIRTHGRMLQQLAEPDFATLLHVVAWLAEHPASGWRIRQRPMRGIDTKWLGGHRAVVESLHAAVSGRSSLGLQDPPALMRVRFLDPALRPGGLCDVIAPVEEFAAMDVAPSVVFVVENLESMFAMPELPSALVVHGSGFAAPRSGCTNVTSVLMDEETLLAYRDLWVPELKAAAGTYPTLTPGEQRVLERIRSDGNVRLEQERIAWAHALAELVGAASIVPEDNASPVT